MKEFTVNSNDAGQRIDKFLTKAVKRLPQSLMYKYFRLKRIKLNGKRCEASVKLKEGDVLSLYINDEFFSTDVNTEFLCAPPTIDIVYEDENIILIDKKCGLVVHEDDEQTTDTAVNRVKHYLYDKGEFSPDKESSFAPALCNRIDRNTSGIVIAAKNAEALRIMNEKIKLREITKKYLCITAGVPQKKEAELTSFMLKDSKNNTVAVYDSPRSGAKTAVTRYKVLRSDDKLALLEVELLTGRTHQIRAQLAHIGTPILGDGKYGIGSINREYNLTAQALCAYSLTFDFPTDAGLLNYLKGKQFRIENVWFEDKYV